MHYALGLWEGVKINRKRESLNFSGKCHKILACTNYLNMTFLWCVTFPKGTENEPASSFLCLEYNKDHLAQCAVVDGWLGEAL